LTDDVPLPITTDSAVSVFAPVPPDPAGRALTSDTTCVVLIVNAVVAAPREFVVCRINEPSSPPAVFMPVVPDDMPLSEIIVEVGISYSY
jgi:hypothetical protein